VLPGAERLHHGLLGLERRPEAGGGGGVAVADRQDGARAGGVDGGEDAVEHRAYAHAPRGG